MRRAAVLFLMAAAALAGLQACGQNPLLRSASADFAPIRVGSQWVYVTASGGTGLTREVLSAGPAQGREAFTVSQTLGLSAATTVLWSLQAGALEEYDATLGWTLLRRLPYVPGNKWDLATSSALVSSRQVVEGLESIRTPAGKFDACYRLKTSTSTYDPIGGATSTAESLVWAAPDIGDVRYADIDASGAVNITFELSSYRIPR